MKSRIIIAAITFVTLFTGCAKDATTDGGSTAHFTLGAVMDAMSTRATTAPLAQGLRFRMYVMPKGEVDITKQILSRTYTIADAAGTPALDAGQDEIKLAIGSYDCYLVGPLTGVNKAGAAVEIAAEMGINVHIGNDIISSVTELNIKVGANTLTPTPLSHRMAKAEFVMERPLDATYTDLKVEKITVSHQPTTGTFVLGADGGSIIPATATETRTYIPTNIPVSDLSDLERFVAVDYLFAQPSKELRIKTDFKATTAAVERPYSQSGLITAAIAAGEFHRFTANPITPLVLLWRLTLVPWSDKSEGSTSSNDLELVCEYSGLDAPVTINGKRYWRDRSGNGLDAELGESATYNATEKYYSGTGIYNSSGLTIPRIGEMKDLTVEVVMSSVNGGRTTPFIMMNKTAAKQTSLHLPFNEWNVYSDLGSDLGADRLHTSYRLGDQGVFQISATWQSTRKVNNTTATGVQNTLYRNGEVVKTQAQRHIDLDWDRGTLMYEGASNTKLYAVRIYRRVLTPAELVNSAKNDRMKYSRLAYTADYVKDGLILDLRGEDAPNTSLVANKSVWQDRSPDKNHFAISGPITHNPATKSYNLPGTSENSFTATGEIGDLSNCTLEFVVKPGTTKSTLIYFSNPTLPSSSADGQRVIHIHYQWTDRVVFNAPYLTELRSFIDIPRQSLTYNKMFDQITQISAIRDGKGGRLSLYQNTIHQATAVATPSIPPVVVAMIGGQKSNPYQSYQGVIYGVRLYNRVLTDIERQANYNEDMRRYNMVVVQ